MHGNTVQWLSQISSKYPIPPVLSVKLELCRPQFSKPKRPFGHCDELIKMMLLLPQFPPTLGELSKFVRGVATEYGPLLIHDLPCNSAESGVTFNTSNICSVVKNISELMLEVLSTFQCGKDRVGCVVTLDWISSPHTVLPPQSGICRPGFKFLPGSIRPHLSSQFWSPLL